jgi:hypothetical protein
MHVYLTGLLYRMNGVNGRYNKGTSLKWPLHGCMIPHHSHVLRVLLHAGKAASVLPIAWAYTIVYVLHTAFEISKHSLLIPPSPQAFIFLQVQSYNAVRYIYRCMHIYTQ